MSLLRLQVQVGAQSQVQRHTATMLKDSNNNSYIRWTTRNSSSSAADLWELQTAVTTFQKIDSQTQAKERIELHAQVHYGEKDYFDFYNRPEFCLSHAEVLYELLVDESLLGLSQDKAGRALTQPLQASPTDRSLARDYGWQCQVDVVDYTKPNWKHADFTRQELLQHQLLQPGKSATQDATRPLWRQVSNGGTALWQPAISALLVGPPSLFVSVDTNNDAFATKRKLFTNLFLPGNQLAGWLRAMLWMTVPSPEISVLLLDWSSLFLSSSAAKLSPVTLPILQSLMTWQLTPLRQLVFGQVLVSGNSAQQQRPRQQDQDWNLLVTQRNDHTLRVLQSSLLRQQSNSRANMNSRALLYGCSHCPDLHSKLVKNLGFVPIKTEWRTAWSVAVPNTFSNNNNNDSKCSSAAGAITQSENEWIQYLPPTAWAALMVLFPLYLGIGAVDWVDCIHSSAVSLLESDDTFAFVSEWLLYLLRHVLLYVGLSKFALEWQDNNNNNNDNP
jgi:hypothetical protein